MDPTPYPSTEETELQTRICMDLFVVSGWHVFRLLDSVMPTPEKNRDPFLLDSEHRRREHQREAQYRFCGCHGHQAGCKLVEQLLADVGPPQNGQGSFKVPSLDQILQQGFVILHGLSVSFSSRYLLP